MSWLVPGETCRRVETADRLAFLIDTEAYFTALAAALQAARHSILIVGWAFDPRTRLFPDGRDEPDEPDEVGHMLLRLVRRRPELEVRVLIWKSALPMAATQGFLPHRARSWFRNTSIRFHLDATVPFGACHHQKVVVIDDRIAFCGGNDLAVDRWDTQGHLEHDLRRTMPDQDCHDPRHEVMVMLDGDAARALGEHARERWLAAVGETLSAPPPVDVDPWPVQARAHICGARVGLACTEPAWRGHPGTDEIRRLALAGIAAAEKTIYLENQYFTSPVITEALAQRLGEPDGPEVVLIATGRSPSWFDKLTMDNARGAMIWRLRSADTFGRFRAFYPVTSAGSRIIVHSKVTLIDDRMARVGSANLNNRSLGFDTELEVAVEADGASERAAIGAFRDRLIGHFLGCGGSAVAEATAAHGGLIPAIDALNRDGRLQPLSSVKRSPLGDLTAAFHLGDPSTPADSFRPWRRRRRLYDAIRARAKAVRQASSKSITSGR